MTRTAIVHFLFRASQAAIPRDQRPVAIVYNVVFDQTADRRVGIYSTSDWNGPRQFCSVMKAKRRQDAIAFSPDGKMLAIARPRNHGRRG